MKRFIVNKANINKYIMIIALTLYVVLTLNDPYLGSFNHDEIHAWNIAANFGFLDIIRLMRSEGHTFLWFFIMKPFTLCDALFPYSMKVLNWGFAFAAIVLLWRFSPFNIVVKMLITFSFPFLQLYPIVARCYSIGILLLFLLAILYKKRLERPVLYALLIFFTANTSLMACFGALALGALFLYDLIKTKNLKKYILPVFILFSTLLILFIQWVNPIVPGYSSEYVFSEHAKNFFFDMYKNNWCTKISYILFPLFPIVSILYFKKRFLFYLLFCWLSIFSVFIFVYAGHDYHFYFLFVHLIIAYWFMLDNEDNISSIKKNIFLCFFILLCLLFNFKRNSYDWHFKTYYKEYANCILDNISSNSTLYTNLKYQNMLIPYAKHVVLKDYNGDNLISFDNFSQIYTKDSVFDLEYLSTIAPTNSYILFHLDELNKHNYNIDLSNTDKYKVCSFNFLYKIK